MAKKAVPPEKELSKMELELFRVRVSLSHAKALIKRQANHLRSRMEVEKDLQAQLRAYERLRDAVREENTWLKETMTQILTLTATKETK